MANTHVLTWNPGSDAGVSASGDRPPNRRLAPTPTWSRTGVKQTRPTRLARVLRPKAALFHRQLTQCTIAELCPVLCRLLNKGLGAQTLARTEVKFVRFTIRWLMPMFLLRKER
jgi:hypothetical protein